MSNTSFENQSQEDIRKVVREEIEKRIAALEKKQEQLFLNIKLISMQLGHVSTLLNHSYEEYLLSCKPVNDTGTQSNSNV